MNNEIKPHYVDFNTAKLLKEKGFDLKSKYHYPKLSERQEICSLTDWNNFTDMTGNSEYFTAPEQWQVVEWLRVNHTIHLMITMCDGTTMTNSGISYTCHYIVMTLENIEPEQRISGYTKSYNTPQKAYSAALDYILKELI
jgi:hypothetical protein